MIKNYILILFILCISSCNNDGCKYQCSHDIAVKYKSEINHIEKLTSQLCELRNMIELRLVENEKKYILNRIDVENCENIYNNIFNEAPINNETKLQKDSLLKIADQTHTLFIKIVTDNNTESIGEKIVESIQKNIGIELNESYHIEATDINKQLISFNQQLDQYKLTLKDKIKNDLSIRLNKECNRMGTEIKREDMLYIAAYDSLQNELKKNYSKEAKNAENSNCAFLEFDILR